MTQPTDPPAASEEPREPLVCPCGSTDHAPLRVGVAFSASDPDAGFYDCPQAPTHQYGLGPAS